MRMTGAARRLRKRFVRLAAGAATLAAVCGAGLQPASAHHAPPQARPARVVSLNLCTDQLVLLLADPDRIAAVSHLAASPPDAPAEIVARARNTRTVRGLAEEVMPLKPDLVVAGVYAARPTVELLRRLGVPVVDFEPESDFDDMRANIRRMGEALGERERAEAMVRELDRRLAALPGRADTGKAPLYARIGANGFVAGRDTLADAISSAAGYRTLGEAVGFSGYRMVSVEALGTSRPDLLTLSTQWTRPPSLATGFLNHPLLRRLSVATPRVDIPDPWWTCGGPFAVAAAERLASHR